VKRSESASHVDRLAQIQDYYSIHTLLRLHSEVTYWIIHWDGAKGLQWREINEQVGRIQPYHFEIYFGKQAKRDAYYLKALRDASRDGKFLVTNLFGFSDLFYPIGRTGGGYSFLFAGQFLTEPLDWNALCKNWRDLTGTAPASANPDFIRFARMALRLPVIEPPLLKCIEEFVEVYAEYMSGERRPASWSERVDKLRQKFGRANPSLDWIDLAVDPEKFRVAPWYFENKLADWMKEEMGICRLPTTVLALMPIDPKGEPLDPVRSMVRSSLIQRECIRHVRQLPETAAGRLQDYGVLFLSSTDPRQSRVRKRLELVERAEQLQTFVRRRFGVESVIGVGRSVPPGEALYPAYNEAVLALHLCIQLQKNQLFYDDSTAPDQSYQFASVHEAAGNLVSAFDRMSVQEMKVASDQFVRSVLIYSNERVEVVRSQLLTVLFQLIASIQKRHLLATEIVGGFAGELTARLEQAGSIYELIEAFREATHRTGLVASSPLEGPKSVRLAWVLKYLEDNFTESLSLPKVARRAGFSVPAFSRAFKQATGTSFLAHLRSIRVEHAKFLLRTTRLTTEQVAQGSGFRSSHHLIRSFKTVTSLTPNDYRKRTTPRAE
jgi:AraC-like DNA-binding protein